jgi:hypothetical protein
VLDNSELGYDWSTYPERLQAAGVSWKIYQDEGTGLDADGSWGWTDDAYIGNYGDNSLLYFENYRNATADSPLYQKARTGTDTDAPARWTSSRSSSRTCRAASSRRSPGSWRPRRSASTRTGRPTTAPGTSRRSSRR